MSSQIWQPPRNITKEVCELLVDGISGRDRNQTDHDRAVSEARKICRNGNPFPLVALQWPSLIVDGSESKFFDGAVGDPLNPCLRLDWWQRLILLGLFDPTIREIFIKGCTGPGKGACVGIGINLVYDVNEQCMFHITSDTYTHALQVMFGEVILWRNQMASPAVGKNGTADIIDSQRRYVTVLNPRPSGGGEAFSGRHGSWYCFDEASSSPSTFFENAYKNAYKLIAISNPRTTSGFFRNAFKGLKNENKTGITYGVLGKRLCVTVGGMDCMNVKHNRLKEAVSPLGGIAIGDNEYKEGDKISDADFNEVKALIPGQMDLNQYRSIVRKSDEKWKVQCFAHGHFPDEDPEAQFIMSGWLKRHHDYHRETFLTIPVTAFGLDVARSLNGDDSCLCAGGSLGAKTLHQFKLDNYPAIGTHVLKVASDEYGIELRLGQNPLCIDYGGGYGAGVGDWLEAEGVWIVQHTPGGGAQVLPEVYQGQRTEDFALLARRLSPQDIFKDEAWAIPEESRLVEELLAITKVWNTGRTMYRALPKEIMKEKFIDGRSPDRADAVMLLFRAVREADQLDEYFRYTSPDLLISYAGGGVGAGKPGEQSHSDVARPMNANKALDELISWYSDRK